MIWYTDEERLRKNISASSCWGNSVLAIVHIYFILGETHHLPLQKLEYFLSVCTKYRSSFPWWVWFYEASNICKIGGTHCAAVRYDFACFWVLKWNAPWLHSTHSEQVLLRVILRKTRFDEPQQHFIDAYGKIQFVDLVPLACLFESYKSAAFNTVNVFCSAALGILQCAVWV